jgi:LPXTG-site transpeptidase (sortase) family protein
MMRTLERVLFAVGIAALAWYATAHIEAAREQAALSRELDAIRGASSSSSSGRAATILPARALVGRIEVPRLHLSALAREGIDVGTLRGSVGHVPGTSLPGLAGNAAFAAHRDTFFGPLQRIRQGDEIVVTTPEGVHRYEVTGTRIVDPSDVSVLEPSRDSRLTLVTCYPFDYVGSAPKRFIVLASLIPNP